MHLMLQQKPSEESREELICPFTDVETNICLASLSAMVVGPHNRRQYCLSENYDDCPLFLAKMMRKR
jgi:hypothetical protein